MKWVTMQTSFSANQAHEHITKYQQEHPKAEIVMTEGAIDIHGMRVPYVVIADVKHRVVFTAMGA